MAADDRTDRFRPVFEPEEIFDRFVKNANSAELRAPRDDEPTGIVQSHEVRTVVERLAERPPRRPAWDHAVTVRANPEIVTVVANPDAVHAAGAADECDDESDDEDATVLRKGGALTDSGQRVVLLTRVKRPETPAQWESVVTPRGQHTQRVEAARVVPDVGASARREAPVDLREGGEDGQMPTRELDSILSDMAVLVRYGHAGQVRERLEQLRRTYPEDLLLLRRIAEFHVEHADREAALDTLFALAGGLFERRNVEGMRQALEQVRVLDPENARAFRLLGLLEQRPRGAI